MFAGARKMFQWLRTLVDFIDLTLSTHSGSQFYVTPITEDLISPSDLHMNQPHM